VLGENGTRQALPIRGQAAVNEPLRDAPEHACSR
jgi:hypothetical protein